MSEQHGVDVGETVDKLLDAAEDAMRQRGYHAVSFRDLADALGIKSASVHYYFPQKEDLGVALVKRYSDRFFTALEAETEKARTPEDRIRAFCKVYRRTLTDTDQICLCGMLGAESCGLPAEVSDAVAKFLKANIDWVAKSLSGKLTSQLRQQRAAHIVATLQGAMILSSSLKKHKIFDNAVSSLREGGAG